jgi:hypothetical protein
MTNGFTVSGSRFTVEKTQQQPVTRRTLPLNREPLSLIPNPVLMP